ncbi:transmembrane protein 80 isoform X2 [Lepus europaeus]|uniref:transmembrane protein 80 isoform X2 n=1 Tax=Lepus europaeus TaxID=9983 RepID=UPI002B4A5920|nr:transmembrane protein 80 isoform X2 [Lepus europaeus]
MGASSSPGCSSSHPAPCYDLGKQWKMAQALLRLSQAFCALYFPATFLMLLYKSQAFSCPPGHLLLDAALLLLMGLLEALRLHLDKTGPHLALLLQRPLPGPGPRTSTREAQGPARNPRNRGPCPPCPRTWDPAGCRGASQRPHCHRFGSSTGPWAIPGGCGLPNRQVNVQFGFWVFLKLSRADLSPGSGTSGVFNQISSLS